MKGYNAFFLQVFPRLEATRLVKRLLNHLVFSHIYCLHILILHIVPLEPLPVKVEPLVVHLQGIVEVEPPSPEPLLLDHLQGIPLLDHLQGIPLLDHLQGIPLLDHLQGKPEEVGPT